MWRGWHFGRLRLSADSGRKCSYGVKLGLEARAPDKGFACQALGPRAPPFARRDRGRVPSATLLDLDAASSFLEVGLELVGLLALDALLDGARGLVDEGLGFLQAEAGRRADDLDDLDLLVARRGEDDVERRLLLGLGAVTVATACSATGGGSRPDGRRGHAELLLERLDALGELEHGDLLELVDPLLGAAGHGYSFSVSVWESVSPSAGGGSGSGPASAGSEAGSASGSEPPSSVGAPSSAGAASAAGASGSGAASSAAAGGASPPTSPCSAICDSCLARPPMSPLSALARPVSGDATMPTSRP